MRDEDFAAARRSQASSRPGRADAAAAGFVLDYLELRDAETLAPVAAPSDRPCRLLVAANLGRTRLIDNIAILALDAETEKKDPD